MMNKLDYCTYVLLGDFSSNEKNFINGVLEDIKVSLKYKEIKLFNINEATRILTSNNSPQSLVLANIVNSGRTLPHRFESIMVEDFLYKTSFQGPVAFSDFPKNLMQASLLSTALSIYRKEELIIVLYFNESNEPDLALAADLFRNNQKYLFFEISGENLKIPHFAELVN